MNEVAEDLLSARETEVSFSGDGEQTSEEIFAVCLETDDARLLVPFKIYRVTLRGEYARVIDEQGGAAIYPKNFFLPLHLPAETVSVLSSVYAHIN